MLPEEEESVKEKLSRIWSSIHENIVAWISENCYSSIIKKDFSYVESHVEKDRAS